MPFRRTKMLKVPGNFIVTGLPLLLSTFIQVKIIGYCCFYVTLNVISDDAPDGLEQGDYLYGIYPGAYQLLPG